MSTAPPDDVEFVCRLVVVWEASMALKVELAPIAREQVDLVAAFDSGTAILDRSVVPGDTRACLIPVHLAVFV